MRFLSRRPASQFYGATICCTFKRLNFIGLATSGLVLESCVHIVGILLGFLSLLILFLIIDLLILLGEPV